MNQSKSTLLFLALITYCFLKPSYSQDCQLTVYTDAEETSCLNSNTSLGTTFKNFFDDVSVKPGFVKTQIILTGGLSTYTQDYLFIANRQDRSNETMNLPYLSLSAELPLISLQKDWLNLSAETGVNLTVSPESPMYGAQLSRGIDPKQTSLNDLALPSSSGDVLINSGEVFLGYRNEDLFFKEEIKLGIELFGLVQHILGDTELTPIQMQNGKTVRVNLVGSIEDQDVVGLISGRAGFISSSTGTNIFSAISPSSNSSSPHLILRENLEGLFGSFSMFMGGEKYGAGINMSGALSLSEIKNHPRNSIQMSNGQDRIQGAVQTNVELVRKADPYTITLGVNFDSIEKSGETPQHFINYKVENGLYNLEGPDGALFRDHDDSSFTVYIAVKYNFNN